MRITPENPIAARGGVLTAWLAVLVLAGVVALTWFGYRAANEWQLNVGKLIERRQQQVAIGLTINVAYDMRALQASIIDRHEWRSDELDSPDQLAALVAPMLRRYEYPEVVFASRIPTEANFVVRASRAPLWATSGGGESDGIRWFKNAHVAELLRSHVLPHASAGRPYSIFRLEIGGIEYQVVMRVLRGGSDIASPTAVVGFMVNMDWARTSYFVQRLDSVMAGTGVTLPTQAVDPTGIEFALLDQNGRAVGARAAIPESRHPTNRRFRAYFFDQAMANSELVPDFEHWVWNLQVSAAEDPALAIAVRGARRTMLVLAAGALALGIGLMIIVRATRDAAAVAAMRSEFVSTVTHELKTPMSVIQSIGQTMVRGRVSSPEQQREYAQLLVRETHRLRHLIDNLLAYARVTDVADVYAFEQLQPEEVVEEALRDFRKLLSERGIDVRVSVPAPLPSIHGDRTSIRFALHNLIDNAMRHADATSIELEARLGDKTVEFVVSDRGQGIPEEELKRVQQPFVRGGATGRGSGLGLAIVRRIAAAHHGGLRLESRVDVGTTATLAIPVTGT